MNDCSYKIFAFLLRGTMAKKLSKVLKLPKQKRSIETFEVILEASVHILLNEKWDQFNTRKIAQKAGVSIGSLYQYFPDKESIFRELCLRQINQDIQDFGELLKYKPQKNKINFFVEHVFSNQNQNQNLSLSLIIYSQMEFYLSSLEISDYENEIANLINQYFDLKDHLSSEVIRSAIFGLLINREKILKKYDPKDIKKEMITILHKITCK